MVHPDAERWIRALGLAPHPEGGWFRETYRSAERLAASALPSRFDGERSLATSIAYLLAAGECSHFHRLRADETWWHHAGGAMHLYCLGEPSQPVVVGSDSPQATVPHGTWFAAEPEPGASFALVGCGVAPGFEFTDFQLGRRADLLAAFPRDRVIVERFTRPGE